MDINDCPSRRLKFCGDDVPKRDDEKAFGSTSCEIDGCLINIEKLQIVSVKVPDRFDQPLYNLHQVRHVVFVMFESQPLHRPADDAIPPRPKRP